MSFTTTLLMRSRDFRIVLVARALCLFGDEAALVALTLRLHDTGGGPSLVALLLGAGLLPLVLLAPLAGSMVDRFDSRTLLVTSSLGSALVCLVLAWTTAPAAVLALVALLGAGQAVAGATWQAMIPALVGEERVGEAMGLLQAGFTTAGIAAPAFAGLLSGAFGPRVPLLVDAGTFVALAAAAVAVRVRRVPATAADETGGARDGLAFLRRDPVVAPLVLSLGVFVLLGQMVNVVEVFLVRDTLASTATWYGLLAAIWATGAVGGALYGGRRPDEAARVMAISLATGVLSLSLLCFAVAPGIWFLVPLSVLGGAANGVLNACAGAVVIITSAVGLYFLSVVAPRLHSPPSAGNL